MSPPKAKLSVREKLDLLPAVATITVATFYALLTGIRRTERQAATWSLHIGYALFRQATTRLSARQMQYILPASHKIYERYLKKTGGRPKTVELDDGALGHWLGDPNADNVLVWFHGGGFGLPAYMGYWKFFARLIRDLEATGKSVAVIGLTYTLAPVATYPTQLRQAVSCVRHVLSQPNRDPASIFLGGDSAGANLVGGVLSHAAHPHPDIKPLSLGGNIGGAVLMGPWTLLDTEFPGREVYHGGDIIRQTVAGPWATGYIGTGKRDNYTDLSNAPTEWFSAFPVNSILVTAGANEILLPLIEDLVTKLKAGFEKVDFFIGRRECHIAPFCNLELFDATKTEQGKRIESYLGEAMV